MNTKFVTAFLVAVAFTAPVLGHHSASMFDLTKRVTLEGTVKEFQWTNPHSWIQIVAPKDGKMTDWSVEANSPNVLARMGWKKTTFKPGDKVTLVIAPMKDGTAGGFLMAAKTAEGVDLQVMPQQFKLDSK